MEEFFARLKEHKLVQWTLAYITVSFALLPALDISVADLRGVGIILPLAGRPSTCIVREPILFRSGERQNAGAAPMAQEATHPMLKEMIDVAAYAGSRKPGGFRRASVSCRDPISRSDRPAGR